jgi:hypothetical protein
VADVQQVEHSVAIDAASRGQQRPLDQGMRSAVAR